MQLFFHAGKYFLMIQKVFFKPERFMLYWKKTISEIYVLGIGSLPLVAIISFFMGAVIVIQTATNISSPLVPDYIIGYTASNSMILEFSTTILGLIMAGKIGSSISTELGTMRITEQIDALEIMGVNSCSYLILPKILALLFINPILMVYSAFIGIVSGMIVGHFTGLIAIHDFLLGITIDFKPFNIVYATTKAIFFGFAIASVPAYFGYYVKGGAVDVGKASTDAVVYTSIIILILNLVLTQTMLL